MLRKVRLLCLMMLLFSIPAYPQSPLDISKQIDQIIQTVDPNINIGISVVNLTTGKLLYKKNADRLFVPASSMKLYTDAAALLYFGPLYRYETTFASEVRAKHKILVGNLYLHFSGDPTLTYPDLADLIDKLPIHTIKGNLILDTSVFTNQPYGPGWMLEDTTYGYGAQNTPVILDQNLTTLIIRPAKQRNKPARVSLSAPYGTIKVLNRVKTVGKNRRNCEISFSMNSANVLDVRGCISQSKPFFRETLAIRNPLLYNKRAIAKLLKKEGISLKGKITIGKMPNATHELVTHYSDPLSHIIAKTLKPSNNILADAVFLKLGNAYFDKPGNWKNGAKAVKEILTTEAKIDLTNSVIVDGSGLSRYNLVSPMQTAKLLTHMYYHFPVAFEYIAALPVAGRDGSLHKRLSSPKTKELVRAKTGTMTGVTALAGYLPTKQNQVLAFSIMINGFTGPTDKYRELEDKICAFLINAVK